MVRVDGGGEGSLICARGLDKSYRRAGEEIPILQGLNLDVEPGEFVAFMGPSGSGKTTLLNLIGGLDVPSSGTITVAGDEITSLSRRKLTAWRARHVGFVFQAYNLIPVLTAYRNVELPLLLTSLSRAERRTHVKQMGNIEVLILAIGSVVFFTLLLVTGNTMAISVRERTGELAVLKALGYSDQFVLGLMLAESVLVAGVGGAIGLWLIAGVVQQDITRGFLVLYLPGVAVVAGIGVAAGTGLLAGLLPAISAMRSSVVDALRRV